MASIVLGVSGSISAYRACDLARDLMRDGHDIRVCLTDAAEQFVTPLLFETLTGNPCLRDVFDEPERGRMAHIDWARQADLILVAPATANVINHAANGQATDMLTTILLVNESPLVIAPAMNPSMLAHEETAASINKLRARGAEIVPPQEGDVVWGERGAGKLAANHDILETCRALLHRSQRLAGKKVLITSGPTREPIDSVRFLSNRSSGKMGLAMARAAQLMGAEVTVVSGPVASDALRNTNWIWVNTAEEMLVESRRHGSSCDWIIGLAAVADYRPSQVHEGKLRRSDAPLTLELTPNPDVIATLAREFPRARTVAFAAEPGSNEDYARQKLARKNVYALAMNDVSRTEIGFESDKNDLTLIRKDGVSESSGQMSKLRCALWLLDRLTAE